MSNYIKKLECQNIGPFSKLEIYFSPKCNIIIGPNGCGKTSILKIICLAFSQSYMNKIRFRREASIALHTIEETKSVIYGGGNLSDIDQGINTFTWSARQIPLKHDEADKVIMFGANQSSYKLFAIGSQRYFNYKKITGMTGETRGNQRLNQYLVENINYLDNQHLPDIKQWMINRYFVIDKDWAEIEKNNWYHLLDFIPKLSPEKTIIQFVKIERDLEPVFSINGRECYLDELSSGFKSILSIIFSIVDWIEGVNEGENARIDSATGTVLIDEVDVHLHPQWQQNILALLKSLFKNIQLIITAHSPLVVSSADSNEVIVIPGNNQDLSLSPQERNFGAWQAEDIMTHLMGVTSLDTNAGDMNGLLDKLDTAIEYGDVDTFDALYSRLLTLISPDDPIGLRYSIKKSELYLKRKDD